MAHGTGTLAVDPSGFLVGPLFRQTLRLGCFVTLPKPFFEWEFLGGVAR